MKLRFGEITKIFADLCSWWVFPNQHFSQLCTVHVCRNFLQQIFTYCPDRNSEIHSEDYQLSGLFTCLASNKLVKTLPPKAVLGKGVFLEMSIARKDQIFWMVPWTFDMTGLGSSKGCRTLKIVGTSLEWKET